jgi:hypothetical protein
MAYKTILALITLLMAATCTTHAMTPQLTMPPWQETKISILSWEPQKSELKVEVKIKALDLTIENLSCEFSVSEEKIKLSAPSHSKKTLNPGEETSFQTLIQARLDQVLWLNVSLRGKPDSRALKQRVAELHKDNPSLKLIMNSEIDSIKDSLYFGRLLPILARSDVALSGVPETTMITTSHKNGSYYLWYPEASIGRGFEAESLKAFATATRSKNHANAEKVGELLINRLKANNKPLLMEKANGDSFMIPINTAIALINANIASLKAMNTGDVKWLEAYLKAEPESDARLMARFNLAQLLIEKQSNGRARAILQELLAKLPSWPLAESAIEGLGPKK